MVRKGAVAAVLLAAVAACGGGSGSGSDAAGCSAAKLDPDLEPDSTLPDAVAETEVAIVRAAVACDDDRLAALADFELGEPRFTTLVELFEGPVVLDGDTYVWPGTEEHASGAAIAGDGTWLSYGSGEDGASVLAATDDGRLVLLAGDGTEERELGTVEPGDAWNGFSVSANGRFAYFDRGRACDAGIVRLNLETGRERRIATGLDPAVSPDGRRLAYLACQQGSDFPDRLVIRRLKSGKEQRIDAAGVLAIVHPSWAPDSRRIAVEEADAQAIRILDLEADDPYASARIIQPQSTDNTFWAGYRGATGQFYAFTAPGGEAGAGSPLPVIAIDAETGRTLETLFALDAQCCVVKLAADRAGTAVLAAGTNAGLVVWRDGEAAPSPVAPGIRIAAWVPTGA